MAERTSGATSVSLYLPASISSATAIMMTNLMVQAASWGRSALTPIVSPDCRSRMLTACCPPQLASLRDSAACSAASSGLIVSGLAGGAGVGAIVGRGAAVGTGDRVGTSVAGSGAAVLAGEGTGGAVAVLCTTVATGVLGSA